MNETTRYFSGAPWEKAFGYCRALQMGNQVRVSGTTAVMDGKICFPQDAGKQTEVIFDQLEEALQHFGLSLSHTVSVQLFLTKKEDVDAVMEVYKKRVGHAQPTATLLIVKELIEPELVVEIALDAYSASQQG